MLFDFGRRCRERRGGDNKLIHIERPPAPYIVYICIYRAGFFSAFTMLYNHMLCVCVWGKSMEFCDDDDDQPTICVHQHIAGWPNRIFRCCCDGFDRTNCCWSIEYTKLIIIEHMCGAFKGVKNCLWCHRKVIIIIIYRTKSKYIINFVFIIYSLYVSYILFLNIGTFQSSILVITFDLLYVVYTWTQIRAFKSS